MGRCPRSRQGSRDAAPPGEKKRLKKLRSFNDFLLAVQRKDNDYLDKHYGSRWQASEPMTASISLKAALGEASGTTGGYTVPLQYARRIMRLVVEKSLIRPGAQKEPMDSKTLQVPLLDVSSVQSTGTSLFVGGVTWTWNQKAQTRTETEPQFKQVELAANELDGQVVLSRPVKDDGKLQGEALDAFLFTLFAGPRIDVSGEASLSVFIKNQLAYRVLKRVDGQPWLDKPITLQDGATQVSPFVVLN